jgi:hypothetical protein
MKVGHRTTPASVSVPAAILAGLDEATVADRETRGFDHVAHGRGGRRSNTADTAAAPARGARRRRAACSEHVRERRRAIAHRRQHAPLRAFALHRLGQLARVHGQRRAVAQPHAGVFVRHARRAQRQDDEVQQRPPQPARQVDDAAVRQEFAQVAAHGAGRGRIGVPRFTSTIGGGTVDGGCGLACRGGGRGHRHRMTVARRGVHPRHACHREADSARFVIPGRLRRLRFPPFPASARRGS